VTVKVLVDGKLVGTVTASGDRPDLVPQHYEYSGWSLSIPTSSLSLRSHTVTAVATDSVGETASLPAPASFSLVR
jgi:hypothetical protein